MGHIGTRPLYAKPRPLLARLAEPKKYDIAIVGGGATGLGVAKISFAMAIAQLVWGAAQPVFGAMADRWGPGRVIVLGAFLLAAGYALTTQVTSEWGLIFALGLLSAAGAGAGSFSILIGATAQRIPDDKRSLAGGVINAGGAWANLFLRR